MTAPETAAGAGWRRTRVLVGLSRAQERRLRSLWLEEWGLRVMARCGSAPQLLEATGHGEADVALVDEDLHRFDSAHRAAVWQAERFASSGASIITGRKPQMFIVQCNVGARAAGRPIPPPSAWRIPPIEDSIESVVDDLLEGQYNNPVRVIGFDAAQRTSRDVSEEVARELRQRCMDQRREPPEFLQEFLGRCESAPSLRRP